MLTELNAISNLFSGIELQVEKIPNWMVVVMGMGTVFVGLICIIILCDITGLILAGKKGDKNQPVDAQQSQKPVAAPIENQQEIIAAVTAVCAEEMGKDVSAIRVTSFKKL